MFISSRSAHAVDVIFLAVDMESFLRVALSEILIVAVLLLIRSKKY